MYRVVWRSLQEVRGLSPLEAVVPVALRAMPLLSGPEPVFETVPPFDERAHFAFPGVSNTLQQAFVSTLEQAQDALRSLRADLTVADAEIQARPTPASAPLTWRTDPSPPLYETGPDDPTPQLREFQRYLDHPPTGVGVAEAHGRLGGQGEGVAIVDVEQGWDRGHEDLLANDIGVLHGPGQDLYPDHGTMVLGVLGGDQNAYGIMGIAPAASTGVAYAAVDAYSGRWNAANAIYQVTARLKPGDVIVLEMHAPYDGIQRRSQRGYVAVEFWQPEFEAIQRATARGVYVVEAAGNGAVDLDSPALRGRFDRGIRDSGAILVGAGASGPNPPPRSRLSFSNYGGRVDLQAWGDAVATAGGHEDSYSHDLVYNPQPSRCYTMSFGGTSSATPIVAGVVAALSGCVTAAGRPPLSPARMRSLLVDTGTPQHRSADRIGPMPDVGRALAALTL